MDVLSLTEMNVPVLGVEVLVAACTEGGDETKLFGFWLTLGPWALLLIGNRSLVR